MMHGVDVSHHQGEINWGATRNAVDFAFVRCCDGMVVPDREWSRNWSEARFHGVRRGVYHFLRCALSGHEQAGWFVSRVGQLEDDDLPPVCDLEELSIGAGVNAGRAVDCSLAWAARVERELGRAPILYTSPNTIAMLGREAHRLAGRYPTLWIAHHGAALPRVPAPWLAWAFWQHSATGRVAGIDGAVDLNWYNGDETDIVDLIEMSKVMASP